MKVHPIHPFPARMDPEAGLSGLLPSRGRRLTVVDPMMGSGSIPVLAALHGHDGIGFDVDPLACTIAAALATPLDADIFLSAAAGVVEEARKTRDRPSWDHETELFVDFWFDPATRDRLGALSQMIHVQKDELRPALWCAFSRLIITKDAGASRARDVSHSRPHRVRDEASFDVFERFVPSAKAVAARHAATRAGARGFGSAHVGMADARSLPLEADSTDVVATSPPYLCAIDYLRGHRMSLVWMGHTIGELREVRGTSIGTERSLAGSDEALETVLDAALSTRKSERVEDRTRAVLRRYVHDLDGVLQEFGRILRPSGRLRFVIADATLFGRGVSVATIVRRLTKRHAFDVVSHRTRALPANRRYLPPPVDSGGTLDKRMKSEQILTFALAS